MEAAIFKGRKEVKVNSTCHACEGISVAKGSSRNGKFLEFKFLITKMLR